MIKQKLLYASPFLPLKSGISDYSEILVYGLSRYFDITLLIDDYKLYNGMLYKDFEVLIYKQNLDLSSFNYRIYNIGNNPYFHSYIYEAALKYPGTIILHDFVLYFLFIGFYENSGNLYSKIYEYSGPEGINTIKNKIKSIKPHSLLEIKDIAQLLPLNKELLSKSRDIIVHSQFTKDMILSLYPYANVLKINMVDMNESHEKNALNKNVFNKKFKIEDNAFVIASFGNIAHTKMNHCVCEAVRDLVNEGFDVYYIMVGDGDYVDHYLNSRIIKTGYVDRDIYNAILERSDLVANLRYPSMGETSISLIHAMGQGKACMVTDDAWFSELPDDTVLKLSKIGTREKAYEKIKHYMQNDEELKYIALMAKGYVRKEHDIEGISSEIGSFLLHSS